MTSKMLCLFEKLTRRCLISNVYPETAEHRTKLAQFIREPVVVYSGFDATHDSLHVGNLLTIMNLIHFQRYGHQVIIVIGDATARIGDPSGHTKDRNELSQDSIDSNAKSIEQSVYRIFNNHERFFNTGDIKLKKPIIVRNSTWYKGFEVVDFVGQVFRPVRVGTLLHKKSISDRLKTPRGLNLSEFCYQVFQAYDWMHLYKNYNCKLQIGGQDQAGNVYTGYDILKKKLKDKNCMGLLTPLIITSDGKKLGKTSSGKENVFLNESRTSPFDLYQFMHHTPDSFVENYLKFFSLYDDDTIEAFIRDYLKNKDDVWFCQRKLAEHVCKLIHGEDGLIKAQEETRVKFGKGTS